MRFDILFSIALPMLMIGVVMIASGARHPANQKPETRNQKRDFWHHGSE